MDFIVMCIPTSLTFRIGQLTFSNAAHDLHMHAGAETSHCIL